MAQQDQPNFILLYDVTDQYGEKQNRRQQFAADSPEEAKALAPKLLKMIREQYCAAHALLEGEEKKIKVDLVEVKQI